MSTWQSGSKFRWRTANVFPGSRGNFSGSGPCSARLPRTKLRLRANERTMSGTFNLCVSSLWSLASLSASQRLLKTSQINAASRIWVLYVWRHAVWRMKTMHLRHARPTVAWGEQHLRVVDPQEYQIHIRVGRANALDMGQCELIRLQIHRISSYCSDADASRPFCADKYFSKILALFWRNVHKILIVADTGTFYRIRKNKRVKQTSSLLFLSCNKILTIYSQQSRDEYNFEWPTTSLGLSILRQCKISQNDGDLKRGVKPEHRQTEMAIMTNTTELLHFVITTCSKNGQHSTVICQRIKVFISKGSTINCVGWCIYITTVSIQILFYT